MSRLKILALTVASILVVVSIAGCDTIGANNANAVSNSQAAVTGADAKGGTSFEYGKATTLIGATPDEVGRFAQRYAQDWLIIYGDTPQVLLTRPVKLEELSTLGMECVGTPGEYDGRPLMLVILKGDFQLKKLGANLSRYHFIAYVFDLTSTWVTYTQASGNGSAFKLVLNDPNLPADERGGSVPTTCTENNTHEMPRPSNTTPIVGPSQP